MGKCGKNFLKFSYNFIENLKFVKILNRVFGKPLKNVQNSSANFKKNLKINFTNYLKQLRNFLINY